MSYSDATDNDEKKRRSFLHPFVVRAGRCPLSNCDAVTSSFATPKTLFLVRLLFAIYCSVTLVVDIVKAALQGQTNFKYFTVITFTALTVYFILSAIHSYQYIKRRSTPKYNAAYSWIYHHLFATNICYHVIVPLIFWTMLRSQIEQYDTAALWTSITMHGGDFAMMATDLVLCNTLLFWIQLPIVILFALLYLVLAVVVNSIEGEWVYSFLDVSKNPVVTAVTIPGIALLCVLLFAVGKYVCKWRNRKVEVEIIEEPIEVRCLPVNNCCMTQCVVEKQSGYNMTVSEKDKLDAQEFPIDDQKDATLEIHIEKLH